MDHERARRVEGLLMSILDLGAGDIHRQYKQVSKRRFHSCSDVASPTDQETTTVVKIVY